MSTGYEIAIKIGTSKIYFRLLLVISILSMVLVIYSSLNTLMKIILIGSIGFSILKNKRYKIQEIRFTNNQWLLVQNKDISTFDKAILLFHNPLFQLIQLTNSKQKKLIVLFDDQLTKEEFRYLHLNIREN